MTDWYDINIEPPLRGIVRHLRNNGVNTVVSCAHEMYIKCSSSGDDIYRLADLLSIYMREHYGEDYVNFDTEYRCQAHFGRISYPLIEIRLYLLKEQRAFLLKEKRRLTRDVKTSQKKGLPGKKSELFRVNKLLHEIEDATK